MCFKCKFICEINLIGLSWSICGIYHVKITIETLKIVTNNSAIPTMHKMHCRNAYESSWNERGIVYRKTTYHPLVFIITEIYKAEETSYLTNSGSGFRFYATIFVFIGLRFGFGGAVAAEPGGAFIFALFA